MTRVQSAAKVSVALSITVLKNVSLLNITSEMAKAYILEPYQPAAGSPLNSAVRLRKSPRRKLITSGYKGFKFTPAWPPDSKKLAWADKDLRLWYADINDKKQVEVDHGEYNEITNYSWSPDSRWIAYDKQLESGLSVVSSSMSSRTQREPDFPLLLMATPEPYCFHSRLAAACERSELSCPEFSREALKLQAFAG